MVKDGGALARATSIGPTAATGLEDGFTRRGGNNDRLSTLWRGVISLAGIARPLSKASSYRNSVCRDRRADHGAGLRSQKARYAKQRSKRSCSEW